MGGSEFVEGSKYYREMDSSTRIPSTDEERLFRKWQKEDQFHRVSIINSLKKNWRFLFINFFISIVVASLFLLTGQNLIDSDLFKTKSESEIPSIIATPNNNKISLSDILQRYTPAIYVAVGGIIGGLVGIALLLLTPDSFSQKNGHDLPLPVNRMLLGGCSL
jgi:hypothetical protein